MGSQNVRAIASKADRKSFTQHLLNDVKALEYMLENDLFEKGVKRVGAEQELCLVKEDYTPGNNSLEILEAANNTKLTTELAKFNLEINLDPTELKGNCFTKIADNLRSELKKLDKVANELGSKTVLSGILPTIRIKDLLNENMTPIKRYQTLNKVLKSIKGDDFKLHIQGVDELNFRHDSILFEACNTSFQVHLQVDTTNAVEMYNWSQVIAGPMLSIMTNSPILLGKELWSETRIALFQQSIDLRNKSHLLRGQKPRVSFGSDWVRNSVVELFTDDIVRYMPIVTSDFQEDSMAKLQDGIMPKLHALNLHNGTLYKWNRMCYGVHENIAHLRIENRYIPSGPSVKDEIANAVFWVGVMLGMPKEYKEIWKLIPFKEAKGNFINAARTGIDTYFSWFGKEMSAEKLIKKVLLPMAHDGLMNNGVYFKDIDYYLGIIETRLDKRATGSKWVTRNKRILNEQFTSFETRAILTKKMYEYQLKNTPVHRWEDFSMEEHQVKDSKNRAYKIMSRELFVVSEEDTLDYVTKMMEWKNIHHIPVLNEDEKVVGMINEETLSKIVNISELSAKDIMNEDFVSIHPDTSLDDMKLLLKNPAISSLIVVYKNELFGIVTQNDINAITQNS